MPGSGKSSRLEAIMESYKHPVLIDSSQKFDDRNFFLNPMVDLVVIDDCQEGYDYQQFYNMIVEGIPVEQKGRPEQKLIYPDFVFTTQFRPPFTEGLSFHARFEVVEME